jgi:hypothetical protein
MSKDKPDLPQAPPHEEKGLITDVVVPLAQAAVGGAVGAAVAGHVARPKDPPKDK